MSMVNGGSSWGAAATGWHCEIDAGGRTHTPSTMDEPAPERNPTANDYPTIAIPVRKDEKWKHPAFEDAPLRVWYNGERQEIDKIEEIEQTESETIIRGRGGTQMDRRYQTEVRQQPTTAFVREAIESTTDYTADIDEPEVEREDGLLLDVVQRDGDFTTRLDPSPTDPVVIEDGSIHLAQTCYPQDGFRDGSITSEDARETLENDAYNGGVAALLEADGDTLRFSIETETQIPSKHVGIKIRDAVLGASSVEVKWDDQLISRIGVENGLGWREVGAYSGRPSVPDYQAAVGAAIEPGETHELSFEATGKSQHVIDAIALYDRRYDYSWPNPGGENGGGRLSGPELYPETFRCWFDAPTPARAVVGGEVEVQMGDGSAPVELGLSNTQGDDFGASQNATEYGVEFVTPGPSLRPVITLSRMGDYPGRGRFPTTGFRSQRVEGYTMRVNVADIPMVVNQTFDGPLVDVLSSVASDANAVFEYRRDATEETIKWTQPGRHTAQHAPSVGSYEITKSTAERKDKVVIYGGTRDVNGERVVVLAGQEGIDVDLRHSRIKQGSVEVEDARSGATMHEGRDFAVGYQNGILDTNANGRMDPGTEYLVSYTYQTYGEYTRPGVSNPTVTNKDASGLTSNFACQQVAKIAVQRLKTPVQRGTLTLSGDEAGYSVVEQLAADDLPGRVSTGVGGIQIKEITASPGSVSMRLGNHRSLDEVVGDFEKNISAVEREI